jgi:hypothetical protein
MYYTSIDFSGSFWLNDKSRKTFDIIMYIKPVFLKFRSWGRGGGAARSLGAPQPSVWTYATCYRPTCSLHGKRSCNFISDHTDNWQEGVYWSASGYRHRYVNQPFERVAGLPLKRQGTMLLKWFISRLHKSGAPDRQGDYILCGGAWYLRVASMELASRQPSGA